MYIFGMFAVRGHLLSLKTNSSPDLIFFFQCIFSEY